MLLHRLRHALLASSALYLSASCQSTSTACNNSPSLCSKAYNNITYLGAHDSPFLRDESTSFSTSGNQYYNTTVQLSAGVRLLTAQVHEFNNTDTGATEWHLCHTSCALLDAGKLSDWLTEVKTWMDSNPNDVVTVLLVNSDNAEATDLGAEFTSSGITKYAYTPSFTSPPTTWPTLSDMISNDTRLVTFVASLSSNTEAPYLLDEFTYVFENNFDNPNATSFSCEPNRPSTIANSPSAALQSNRMFLMNHFLYQVEAFGIETPDTANLATTNSINNGTGALGTSLDTCATMYGKQPNFALVDFFNVGPAISSIDRANGISDAVNRIQLTTAQLAPTSNGGIQLQRPQGSMLAIFVGLMLWAFFA